MAIRTPEISHEPQVPNLLLQLGDRPGQIEGIHGTMQQLATLCPKDLVNDPTISVEMINDFVITTANESGWQDIPDEYQPLFAETLARLNVEPNVTFGPSNSPAPEMNAINPVVEPTAVVQQTARKTVTEPPPVQAIHETRPPSPKKEVHEAYIATLALAVEPARENANMPEFLRQPAVKVIQNKEKAKVTTATTVEKPVVTNKKIEFATVVKRVQEVASSVKVELKQRVETPNIIRKSIEQVVKPKPKVFKIVHHEQTVISKEPELQAKKLDVVLPAPSIVEEKPQLGAETLPEMIAVIDEYFDEPIGFKVAEAPLRPATEILVKLLAFPAEDDFQEGTVAAEMLFDTDSPLQAKEQEAAETYVPFSEQLETFVQAAVPAEVQELALQQITVVRELVELTIEDDIDLQAELFAEVDVPGLSLSELIELPVSEELQAAVTELLQTLGIPEPTELQVRQCVAKFRVEVIQARKEQAMTDRINDILHERHYVPSLRDITQTLLSADFHRLIGQLAVFMV